MADVRIHSIWAGMGYAHLIESQAGLVLVDAGSPRNEQRVLRQIYALGRGDLRLIYITHAHFDHYGSAAALRRLTGAPIAIHPADAEAMAKGETRLGSTRGRGKLSHLLLPLAELYLQPEPTSADVIIGDGDNLHAYGLDARTVHTPGHTPGSSCLLVQGRIAFVGDLISTTGWPHPQRLYADNWLSLAQSLDRLKRIDPEWVYAGHGRRPIRREALRRLSPA